MATRLVGHVAPHLSSRRTNKGGLQTTWLYRQWLRGPAPKGVAVNVPILWPGAPEVGAALLTGRFAHKGESHMLDSAAHVPFEASEIWLNWFHGLHWLVDIAALSGGERGGEAPYFAREWLSAWMDANTRYDPIAWAPEVTANRVINVIRTWSFLVRDDAAGPFEKMLRHTLGRDTRHIFRSPPPSGAGYARLVTLKGQSFAALALKGFERKLPKALARLETEINAQVLPDGGYVERNPARLADVLRDLLELKALIAAATGQMSGCVQNAIDRAAPMLRQLRHPDGGLSLFNGAQEGDAAEIDLLLAHTDAGAKAPGRAPYAGFQRLTAGNVTLIMDCGKPVGPGRRLHAGTLSFEMSVGAHRLVVNCGARPGEADPWRTALAATAAHSTLTVNDTSSAAFNLDGSLHRGPDSVTCARTDGDDGVLVEASHDGYLNTFGLIHHCAIFVEPSGESVRGEDRLSGTGGEYFTLRFHLHPSVKASLLGGSDSAAGVLLRFGGRTKETWRLRASFGEIALESSVYLGHGGEQRRTEQIVISGPLTGNGALIKWAFLREGSK
ncbi:MAG: heparinase II/III family protein [Rhodospirillales bacterium]|nr:heparinase II/III family protein [Rhodospirillales bacterium]